MLYLDMQPHSWTCLVARLPPRAQNYLSKSLFVCIGDRAERRGEGDRRSSIDLDLSTMKRVSISGRSDDDKLGGGLEEDNMKDADRTEGDEDCARERVLTWTQIG